MAFTTSSSAAWASSITLEESKVSTRPVHSKQNSISHAQPVSQELAETNQAESLSSFLPPRFWADFTMGFSDGLTVPFALTAGLSSLGRTDTVIYAGLAEVSAGCISMGISGYLSARQALLDGPSEGPSKEATVASLGLPAELEKQVMQHVSSSSSSSTLPVTSDEDAVSSPLQTACSVAIGYIIGGFLPLWPYFFVVHVGDGLRWSVAGCIIALFLFGFLQEFYREGKNKRTSSIWSCVGGGLQMVTLCGIASLAAVLCVYIFEGKIEEGER